MSRYSRIVANTSDIRDDPITEATNPSSTDLDSLESVEIVRLMNTEDSMVVQAVGSQASEIAAAIDAISLRLRSGGRMFYLGAGTSGRLGILDASECPPTFDTDSELVQGLIAGGDEAIRRSVEGAEDDVDQAGVELDARQLQSVDCVIGIATSGTTPYVVGGLQHARSKGCLTFAITCNHGTPLAAAADHAIELLVGPEVLTGSTRLKAGTATKMVLNMLSTGVMVRLGKTYGNLMVDLQAGNSKLRDRALRLLIQLTGLQPPAAQALLSDCGGELKTSVVAHRLVLSPAAARDRLAANDGGLRAALQQTS
ncbi:MAG: N-acetylmuramic acid 6-phosphate etherase [Planctomycetota bacterium]|nr:N-acetylmuramic acid 6-phosphate etherase [Planctomycetota bacterium]